MLSRDSKPFYLGKLKVARKDTEPNGLVTGP